MRNHKTINGIKFLFSKSVCFIFLYCLLSGFVSTSIYAQNDDGRANDIKELAKKISGNDPIENVVATEEALNSTDPVLRSIALEMALQSKNMRVRDSGFRYIACKLKNIIMEISVSEKNLDEIQTADKKSGVSHSFNSKNRGNKLISYRNVNLKIKECNDQGLLKGEAGGLGAFEGVVGSGSIILTFHKPWHDCKLQLRNFDSGYLNGSFSCAGFSYAVKGTLP